MIFSLNELSDLLFCQFLKFIICYYFFMLKNYQVLAFILTLIKISNSWGFPTGRFCSAICKPNNCNDLTPNGCTSCDNNFMPSGGTCVINPNSGWSELDASQDLNGGLVIDFQSTPSGICGNYVYFGNINPNQAIMVSSITGVPSAYYSIQLIYWVILIDKWDPGLIVATTLNQANIQINETYTKVHKTTNNICASGKQNQNYLKMVQTWSYNATNIQLDFAIQMFKNTQSNPWGAKQFQLLVKYCNQNCDSCWTASINNCWSCNANIGMLLNNYTCNQSCFPGYGYTSDGMTCVWCNLRCSSCFELMDNCSACTTSGKWQSFLVESNYSCVAKCPDGYFGNVSTHICDLCDPVCKTCAFNPTHCYDCISGYGWNSYYCYNPCPIGTFTDLTHPAYNGTFNCTSCSKFCIQCLGPSTNCTSCTLTGMYQAYLLDSTCYRICPAAYYNENYNNTGPNVCLPCDISCATCTNFPTPCQSCNPTFYLYQSACGTSCPEPAFFPDNFTWSCLDCSIYCTRLKINMYFPNSMNSQLYIDMNFTQNLNFSTFDMENFQTISTDSTSITLNMFNIQYVQTGLRSYRIILVPKGYIFIYNITFTVITTNQPTPIDQSINYRPFKSTNYQLSANQKWFLIKAPSMSSLEQSIINGFGSINDKISMVTTLPYFQQIKKSGVFSLLMGGAQITSCSVLVNTIPSQNMYQGVRFWAMFVFFDVPKWQKNSNKTKYVVVPPSDDLIKDARLLTNQEKQRMLFDISTVDWRFQRTGHTSFFIFDCYMNVFMILFCWALVIIGQCIIKKKKSLKEHLGKFYSLLHKVHQITILYISLATLLEWIYFDASSVERWVSFFLCLLANMYFLGYELYIYYDMLNYPKAKIGDEQYEYYVIKYGSFLKNVRYNEFDHQQDWSPKQWFRPYNYHFISYYKKLLMMISLPLFYDTNNTQIYVLIFIQVLEILRFCFTWPFKTKSRNIVRLILQLILLFFFLTITAQQYLIGQVVTLDTNTQADQLQTYINLYYNFGWVSFVLVFLFNIGFLTIFIYDTCLGFKKSNRELMDQARRNFYMQKLKSYQQENENVPLGMVNKWVKLGNLNKRNLEDLPKINLRIQYYRISPIQKSGYSVQVKKLLDVFMNVQFDYHKQNNLTVSKKLSKRFVLKRSISPQFYSLISNLYKNYSQKYNFQSLLIKTFVQVEQSQYKPGEKIKLEKSLMSQKIQLQTYNSQRKKIQLQKMLSGFPINPQLLSNL